jgi:hypothetical protein
MVSYPIAQYPTTPGAYVVSGTDLNKLVDAANDLNQRVAARAGCRLRRVANQSIGTGGSPTAMSFDTEDEDIGGFFAPTSTTITIPTGQDGAYGITFFAVGVTTTGRLFGSIVVASALTGFPAEFRCVSSGVETIITATTSPLPLLAADTIQCKIFHTNGASANFTGWLSCYRIGN